MIPICKPSLKRTDIREAKSVLKTKNLVQGVQVRELEKLIRETTDSKYAIALSSCTAALHTTLLSIGVQPGDLVAVPTFSWVATSNVVEAIGATPVFVDIESQTFNMDTKKLEQTLNNLKKSGQLDSLKAVMLVHNFGTMGQTHEILNVCNHFEIPLIEDAACALGARELGIPAGSIGKAGCFSFHPRKLVTTGEGGVLVTDNSEIADFAISFRDHGKTISEGNSKFIMAGLNYRMTDFQAALGVGQIKRLKVNIKKRQLLAERYFKILKDLPLQLPVSRGEASTWQSFVVLLDPKYDRDEVIVKLAEKGIETNIGTIGLPFINNRKETHPEIFDSFKVLKKIEDASLALPMFESLRKKQQGKIFKSLKEILEEQS